MLNIKNRSFFKSQQLILILRTIKDKSRFCDFLNVPNFIMFITGFIIELITFLFLIDVNL